MSERQQNAVIVLLYVACTGVTMFALIAGLTDW